MDVNSQILYAEIIWVEMEKADSTRNWINNAGKAKLWSMVEIKILFFSHAHV